MMASALSSLKISCRGLLLTASALRATSFLRLPALAGVGDQLS